MISFKTRLKNWKNAAPIYILLFKNIAEFWNVCTRPVDRNGYALSIAETNRRVNAIELVMTLLPDSEQVYAGLAEACRLASCIWNSGT